MLDSNPSMKPPTSEWNIRFHGMPAEILLVDELPILGSIPIPRPFMIGDRDNPGTTRNTHMGTTEATELKSPGRGESSGQTNPEKSNRSAYPYRIA